MLIITLELNTQYLYRLGEHEAVNWLIDFRNPLIEVMKNELINFQLVYFLTEG